MRLTTSQKELTAELRVILSDGPKNTHQIAKARGDRQAYESHLRNRLYRLEKHGIVSSNRTGHGRLWTFTKGS